VLLEAAGLVARSSASASVPLSVGIQQEPPPRRPLGDAGRADRTVELPQPGAKGSPGVGAPAGELTPQH